MTKQQVQQPSTLPNDYFELNERNLRTWLLSPFEKQRQPIIDARRRMRDEGISDKMIEECTFYEQGTQERSIKEFLKLCTNKKTQQLWDLETLQNAGKLSEGEIFSIKSKHNNMSPPYYFIHNIRRILDDRVNPPKEYLVCNFLVEALCVGKREGVINPEPDMRINESGHMGSYYIVHLEWQDIVDRYDKNNTEEKRIAIFNSRNFGDGNGGTQIYDIPWSREVFEQMMAHTKDGKVALSVTRLSSNKHYSIKTIDEFCTENLVSLVERLEEPRPTYKFDIDPKALAEFMKFQQAKNEQGEQHFQ